MNEDETEVYGLTEMGMEAAVCDFISVGMKAEACDVTEMGDCSRSV